MAHVMDVCGSLVHLNGIVLTVNGTVSRATVNVWNTFQQIQGHMPDVVLANLCLVLTNVAHLGAKNFDLGSLPAGIQPDPENIFTMQNSAFSADRSILRQKDWDKLQEEWDESLTTIQDMVQVGAVTSNVPKHDHLWANMFVHTWDMVKWDRVLVVDALLEGMPQQHGLHHVLSKQYTCLDK